MIYEAIMEFTGVPPIYCGVWNAAINVPTIMSGIGERGAYFKISDDGKTKIDGANRWKAGDIIFFDGAEWSGLTYEIVLRRISKDQIDEPVNNQIEMERNNEHTISGLR